MKLTQLNHAAMAAFELRTLLGELRSLEGSWLEGIYDVSTSGKAFGGKEIAFKLAKSESKRFLVVVSPAVIFCSDAKPKQSEAQSAFCRLLRDHFGNAKLLSVGQVGCERILELVFSKGRLFVELFSHGNLILVGEGNLIIGAAEHQSWKDRTIRPGFTYSLPPSSADFGAIGQDEFTRLLLSSDKGSVVKALAVDAGLSGTYAQELCILASVDKNSAPASLTSSELHSLHESLMQILSMALSPIAVLDQSGFISAAFPFPIAEVSNWPSSRSFASFSSAIEAYFWEFQSKLSDSKGLAQRRQLEFQIGQQKLMAEGLACAVDNNNRAGELIYEHYQEVRQVLDDYNRLRKTFTPDELRAYFRSNMTVKSIDEKKGVIEIEL